MALAAILGFGLRLWEIDSPRVYGDGAYSVYLAGLDPATMAGLTAQDSHPPLYYLILWAATGLAGPSELVVRFPSFAAGALLIPLTYAVGTQTVGRLPAVVGAWLVALSPYLIYYSRFPRMYTLLAAVALVSAYLLTRALAEPDRRGFWIAHGTSLWLAVHIHYFGAVLGVAEGVLLIVLWRRGRRAAPRLLLAAAVAALASIPWLTYGFFGSARFTAGNIANAPPPEGPGGFLEQFGIPFHFGPLIEVGAGRLLIVPVIVILLVLLLLARRSSSPPGPRTADGGRRGPRPHPNLLPAGEGAGLALPPLGEGAASSLASAGEAADILPRPVGEGGGEGVTHRGAAADDPLASFPVPPTAHRPTSHVPRPADQDTRVRQALPIARLSDGWLLTAGLVALPLLFTFAIFLVFPYFARQRFLAFSVPFYLLIVGAGFVAAYRRAQVVAVIAGAAWLLIGGWALRDASAIDPLIYEPDTARLTELLAEYAEPGDLVILQAAWQFGYLRSHYRGPAITPRALIDVDPAGVDRLLADHGRIWLGMYQRARRDPDFPLEEALDERLAKLLSRSLAKNRVSLYARPPAGPDRPLDLVFVDPRSGVPVIRLAGIRLPNGPIQPGQGVAALLDWRALEPITRDLAVYLHLDSLDGRTWAGRDAEPRDGLAPTSTWRAGDTISDPRGVAVPALVPPGAYRLTTGLYDVATGEQLIARRPQGVAELGQFEVSPGETRLRPAIPIGARFGLGIALDGATVGPDGTPEIETTVRQAYLDNPVDINRPRSVYRPGDSIETRLFWRATEPVPEDLTVFVHLVGPDDRPVAQQDNPPVNGAYPTSRWRPGATVIDPYRLTLPPDLPPGRYRLTAGLYRPGTGERLPVRSGLRGTPDNRVIIETITVEPGSRREGS